MSKQIPVIQLYGTSGNDIGLFTYDPAKMSETDAVALLEQALENTYQREANGEEVDFLNDAEEEAAKQGVTRIFAAIANTDRL